MRKAISASTSANPSRFLRMSSATFIGNQLSVKSLRRVSARPFPVKAASLPLSGCSAIFSALKIRTCIVVAKGLLLLSVSPPFWDFEDDEDPVILEIVSEERQKLPPDAVSRFWSSAAQPLRRRSAGVDGAKPFTRFCVLGTERSNDRDGSASYSRSGPSEFSTPPEVEGDQTPARNGVLDPGTTDNWWFDTLPENRYQLELGLYWSEYGWLPMLASSELVTPRLALGPASEEELPQGHTFLENLVQQTGIGLQQRKAPSLPPTNVEGQPESDTSAVEKGRQASGLSKD